MMKAKAWHRLVSALVVVACSTVGGAATAETQSVPTVQRAASDTWVAQGSLVGQSRCAKQPTAIFSDRSATSIVVRALATNQAVTLSENAAQGGFIGVSAPSPGFVQPVNLKVCPTSPGDGNSGGTPAPSLCRAVRAQAGLIVRRGPSTNNPVVGGVAFNSQVFVTRNPPASQVGPDGRIWVEINRPIAGWVSNGFRNIPGSNLVYCQ
ncbi:SH3 domain-containing protein [Myxacorys almedinensis]|uniref:SH3 domain-containing protein n=1 Tax=Myxacorys almedinensis A TaxID=2690445 RepID=A0A8J7Z994_9CYAN|nr:SH3 domain-containing protein [Myxacorys almedinensis]NDJ18778.1 SH3 domain-containing protein [Myxacorys almedinensis A]